MISVLLKLFKGKNKQVVEVTRNIEIHQGTFTFNCSDKEFITFAREYADFVANNNCKEISKYVIPKITLSIDLYQCLIGAFPYITFDRQSHSEQLENYPTKISFYYDLAANGKITLSKLDEEST